MAYAFYVSWKTSIVLIGLIPCMSLSTYFLMKLTTDQSKDVSFLLYFSTNQINI